MFKDKHATALACSVFLLVLAFPQTMLASHTYTDVTAQMGISVHGLGNGTAWGDFDGNSDEDCYVGRTSTNLLYRNNGNGTFTDIVQALNLVNPPDPFGTGFADKTLTGTRTCSLRPISATSCFGAKALRTSGSASVLWGPCQSEAP